MRLYIKARFSALIMSVALSGCHGAMGVFLTVGPTVAAGPASAGDDFLKQRKPFISIYGALHNAQTRFPDGGGRSRHLRR